jgi:rare lipoprotein A
MSATRIAIAVLALTIGVPPVAARAAETITGIASWYGPRFHHRPTANGERFDRNGLTAASRDLPLPTVIRVTNLDNGRSLVLRVNDRGPYFEGRILDVSERAAHLLVFHRQGLARVRIEVLPERTRLARR